MHFRYKRQVADRLALAAWPVAYGLDLEKRYQGPLPTSFVRHGSSLQVTYDDGKTVLEARDLVNATAFEVKRSVVARYVRRSLRLLHLK